MGPTRNKSLACNLAWTVLVALLLSGSGCLGPVQVIAPGTPMLLVSDAKADVACEDPPLSGHWEKVGRATVPAGYVCYPDPEIGIGEQ